MLDLISRWVTARPLVTLSVLLALTIVLGAGVTQLAPQAESTAFLPADSKVALATETIDEQFGGSRDITRVNVLFYGDPGSPEAQAQIGVVLEQAVAHELVRPLLVDVLSPLDTPARLMGEDEHGGPVSVAYLMLREDADGDGEVEDDEETLEQAELAIQRIALNSQGALEVGSLSPATISKETSQATGTDMILLMLFALAMIALLLLIFTRSLFDVVLAIAGLLVTIIWVIGAQGWLGPKALGLIGPPNTLTTMVPIMLIGLVVDYAIQTVGLYRERRAAGERVASAAATGLRAVMIPLSLAAVTTIVSFFTNLSSPIPANADFGVVAGIGVGFGLVVMLSLMASSRALLDRWREGRNRLPAPGPIVEAIPGIGFVVEALGGQLARRPLPFLVAVVVVTIVLGVSATRIETVFDSRDFLPSDGDAIRHVETLDAAFGGQTDTVKVLIDAELTDDRTVRNTLDFTVAFNDDLRRPEGAVGELQSSVGLLLLEWLPRDEQLRRMADEANQFRLDPAELQAILDRLEELDPEGFAAVAVDNPDDTDYLLMQFQALTGDQQRTSRMVRDIEGIWYGDPAGIAAVSGEVTGLEVVGAMTDSQTSAIVLTILAALIILMIFFWLTERRMALGIIAVAPIGLVLIWVLGTMALLDIPYNVVTALITALSIGIGVDYTIHIIHRYEEEFHQSRDPDQAARRTLRTTGSALLGSALTTALGFGMLTLSSLTPFQQFGIVTAITIAYALVAAIVVVPPMMIVWAVYQEHRLRSAARRAAGLTD